MPRPLHLTELSGVYLFGKADAAESESNTIQTKKRTFYLRLRTVGCPQAALCFKISIPEKKTASKATVRILLYISLSSLRYSAAKDASVQVSWLRDQRTRLPSRSTVAFSTALLHYSGGTAQDSHLLPSQLLTDYLFRRTQSRIFNLFSVF